MATSSSVDLTQIAIFAELSKRELKKVERLMTPLDLKDGATLTRQGEPGREFMIIADGTVRRSGDLAELRGGGSGVIVELDDGHDVISERLRQRGLAVERQGLRLIVDVAAEAPPDEGWLRDHVRDAVAEARVGLRLMTDRTLTLEDVFLQGDDPA